MIFWGGEWSAGELGLQERQSQWSWTVSLTNTLRIELKVSVIEHEEAVAFIFVLSSIKWCNVCQILQKCSKYESTACNTLRYMAI